MASSLLLAGEELLGDCNAPGVHLLLEYDLGEPEAVTATVQALLLDGEKVLASRAGNRVIELPLVVKGSTRANLSARMQDLLTSVKYAGYDLTWTPDGGLEIIWDCYAATYDLKWDVRREDRLFVQQVTLTIPAAPYGRSPDLATATLTQLSATLTGKKWSLSDLVGSAPAAVNVHLDLTYATGGVDAWLLHKPPVGANPAAPIMLDVSGSSVAVAGAQILNGTYTVVLGVTSYGSPGQNREVEVVIEQDGTSLSTTLVKAYVSSLALTPLIVGNVTLPLAKRPDGSTSSLTVTITDSGSTTFHSLLLLDTRGQTVASFGRVSGIGLTKSAWIEEGGLGDPVGPIWNSPTALLVDAYAAALPRLSGGPLTLCFEDEDTILLSYAAGAIGGTPTITYRPRWLAERTI